MALKDKYFTISEAAKELRVTRQTISRWITQGKIPAEKVGRETLIKKKDLHKYHRLKLSEAAADSILNLYIATVEDYCREKGYITADTPTRHVEFVGEDTEDGIIIRELSAEEKAEIFNRFRPILEGFLKDFAQDVGRKENPPKNNKGGKTSKK